MEIGDFELKIGVLLSLMLSLSGVVLLALYKKASDDQSDLIEEEQSELEGVFQAEGAGHTTFQATASSVRPLVEGCIIEYTEFFLKADSGGFVVTDAGDLSIEFFRDKLVEVSQELTLRERLENTDTQYVPTNVGAIHRQHFVVKGA
ncbi:MAG: hypothetical protein AAF202_10980 [Pseudomonadota bacterium]